jgi:hypothetical protein
MCVHEVRGPGPLEPDALAELAFPPEAETLEKTPRSKVACVRTGAQPVHLEFLKPVLHHRPNGLRRIPLALMIASERKP